MCLYGIFGDDSRVYHLRGEATKFKESKSNCINAHAQEPSRHPSFQWLGPILLLFCKKSCFHYGTNHKINAQIRIVHLDMKEPKNMGNNQT